MALSARLEFAVAKKDDAAVRGAYEQHRDACRRVLDVERNRLVVGTGAAPNVDQAGYELAVAEQRLAELSKSPTPEAKKRR
jgi:hypothetical protein